MPGGVAGSADYRLVSAGHGAVLHACGQWGFCCFPRFLTRPTELTLRPGDLPLIHHARLVAHSILRQTLQQGFALACLPYEAFLSFQAISRTLVRLLVTGRKVVAVAHRHEAQRAPHRQYFRILPRHVGPAADGGIGGTGSESLRPHALAVAAPVIGLWFVSPAIAFWLSRPIKARRSPPDRG